MTEVAVTYGCTINLGNYESMHVDLTSTVRLDPGDNADEARQWALNSLQADVHQAMIAAYKQSPTRLAFEQAKAELAQERRTMTAPKVPPPATDDTPF